MKLLKFFFLFSFSYFVSSDDLTINLSGQTKAGVLSLAIFDNPKEYTKSVKGEKRTEDGIFSGIESYIDLRDKHSFIIDLPEGTYAIALFVDVNKNLKIDKNFFGIPKEQYGFSNNAMGKLSAPTFEQAMFKVQGKTIQNILLK